MKNEMYTNLLAEISSLNTKVEKMMQYDDDDDGEDYDDISADLKRIGGELEDIGKTLSEMYNNGGVLDDVSKSIDNMDMEQTMSYIDEVKKAKAKGFDFSIEHLEERRKAREEEIMKKEENNND